MSKAERKQEQIKWRASVRKRIKSSAFNRTEKDIFTALLNVFWSQNHGTQAEFGGKGAVCVYPGRDKLAKVTQSSIRSVASALDKGRKLGFLKPNGSLRGGSHSTRYIVLVERLYDVCGLSKSDLEKLATPTSMNVQELHIAMCNECATIAHGIVKNPSTDVLEPAAVLEKETSHGNVIDFTTARSPVKERTL